MQVQVSLEHCAAKQCEDCPEDSLYSSIAGSKLAVAGCGFRCLGSSCTGKFRDTLLLQRLVQVLLDRLSEG